MDDTSASFHDLRRIAGAISRPDDTAGESGDLRRITGPDAVIGWFARRQEGLVTRAQLIASGLNDDMIRHRLRSGRLHQVHPGVYAVGHSALTPRARDLAAVLACGPGAVLSHQSAAAYHQILPRHAGPVHVTRPNAPARRIAGVKLHRPRTLPTEDTSLQWAVPVTTPTRTLLDLATTEDARTLERALNEAQVRRLVDLDQLKQRARPALRALLDEPTLTRSEAERKLLQLIAKAGLPRPRTNVRVQGYEVDLLWPDHKLIVEVDGFASHGTRTAFEKDRRRDQTLTTAGYRVLRITWRQLTEHPEATVATLAAALTSRS